MRNLKKILALVLALVMSLSLMATAGASQFPDVDESNPYATAIDVLDELKVFQGFDDGTFKPTETLNRAQAAALVYRIATGDVEGKYVDNYTYMAQSKFNDLEGYGWARGYINYCQNAEIVVGTSATTFDPGAKVTGYQLLVMLLRTLGYGKAGEFADPKGWELQTATIAEREGILKNITSGDLGAAAPRQMVAEILFQGLLAPTVEYTALSGYAKGETLGKKNLGLERLEGIVMANEYASLTGDSTLADGKTELKTDDRTYTLNIGSTLDDIGEYRYTYVIPASGSRNNDLVCTGLFGDESNVTFESTDKADISNASKFASVTGMNSDSATEHFVNFSNNAYVSSDYRLSYVLNADDLDADEIAALVKDGATGRNATGGTTGTIVEYVKIIRPNTKLSSLDRYWIKAIFDEADKKDDYIEGEVYVGTQSNTDISDKISYNEFVDTYLKDGRAATVTANDNGNWIKAIDNNNDGVAEYIFKVVYTFAQVSRVRDGSVTLDVKNETLDTTDDINELTNEPVVCADELGVGDVVYYAIIDGKAQTYVPEMVTAKIDKVNRNTLTATTTDGAEYVQSEVHDHILSPAFEDGVKNLSGTWTYDLYLDRGGYLATFTQTTTAENYALLVDGWFMAQRGGDEYAAKVYNRETKELDDTDITSGGSWFIGNSNTDNNRWNSIKALGNFTNGTGALNDDDGANTPRWIRTTVVALSEDGAAVPVDTVYNEKSRVVRMLATEDNKIPGRTEIKADAYRTSGSDDRAYDLKDVSTTTGGGADGKVEVRALTSTVYYVVYPLTTSNGVVTNYLVKEYVGYGNVPDEVKNGKIDDVYAVGTQQTRLSGIDNDVTDGTNVNFYYTADVVVVEMKEYEGAAEEVFIYDVPEVHNNVTIENVGVIRGDGTDESVDIDFARSDLRYYNPAYGKTIDPGLYYMYETETEGLYTIQRMSHDDIRASRYATGWSATSYGTVEKDYVEVNAFTYDATATAPFRATQTGKTNEYGLTDSSKLYSLSYSDYNNVVGSNKDYSADLSAYDAEKDNLNDYLGEIVDRTNRDTKDVDYDYENDTDGVYWNHNDLLVKYDSSNKVVYAISFANFEGKVWNLAQNIWNDVKPSDTTTGNVIVTVPGVDAAGAATTYSAAWNGANDQFELTLDYWQVANGAAIDVENGKIVIGAKNVVKPGTVTGTVLGEDEEYYAFTITVNAQRAAGKLITLKNDFGFAIMNDDTLLFGDPNATLSLLKKYLDCTGKPESKVDLDSVKGYYGGIEKTSADDKLNEMDEIHVDVVNIDGDRTPYIFRLSDGTLQGVTLATLTLSNDVRAYTDETKTEEYASGDKVAIGSNVYFAHTGYGTFTGTGIDSPGVTDGRDADGDVYIIRTIAADATVGFTVAATVNGTFTFELTNPTSRAYAVVPNSGDTALPGHDGIDYFIYAKHSPAAGQSWMDIGLNGLTATGVANWFTVTPAGAGVTARGSWDDFDNGKFHYTAEGKNGGTTQRTYYEFITLDDPHLPAAVTSVGTTAVTAAGAGNPDAYTVSLVKGTTVNKTDIVFDVAVPAGAEVTMRIASATGPEADSYELSGTVGDTVKLYITVTAADGIQVSSTFEITVTTV